MYRSGILLFILLAGCSGATPPAMDTSTVTPAPIPSETWTPTPDSRLPAGITVTGGVTDPWLVTTRSTKLLSRAGYARNITEETRYANGTIKWRREQVTRVGDNRLLAVETHHGRDRPGWPFASADRVEMYREHRDDPTRARSYWAVTKNGETRYEELDGIGWANSRTLFQLLSRFDTHVTGQAVRNGAVVYRIELESRGEPKQMKYADRTERARNVSLSMLVDSTGIIREWRIAYTTVNEEMELRYIRTERVSDIGSTVVSRPTWVNQFRGRGTPTPIAAGSQSSGAEP